MFLFSWSIQLCPYMWAVMTSIVALDRDGTPALMTEEHAAHTVTRDSHSTSCIYLSSSRFAFFVQCCRFQPVFNSPKLMSFSIIRNIWTDSREISIYAPYKMWKLGQLQDFFLFGWLAHTHIHTVFLVLSLSECLIYWWLLAETGKK